MKLSQATVMARTQAIAHGHALTDFVKDSHKSAAAHCVECGRIAAVDVSEGGPQVYGRAIDTDCRDRRITDMPDETRVERRHPRLTHLHGLAWLLVIGQAALDNLP